jgi:diaminohydroxyphosphoribosylaminopyrimidine deaminase/5-amino-6-(5-phosphoribosylamino)uracil reductase
MDDKSFMKLALNLAAKGCGFTSPNPMVGAVIVRDGIVVGTGFHEAIGMAHAEVNAIKEAGDLAKGATLYVTLEPCNHHGRTPPCTDQIKDAGISRVVVAMKDPNPDVKGRGIDHLKKHGINISLGLYEDRATNHRGS